MVPVLPLPQSQIPICPHGLTSKPFAHIPLQIRLTVVLAAEKQAQAPYP